MAEQDDSADTPDPGRELAERVTFPEPPEPGFDIRGAQPRDLIRRGLPPRPDPDTSPLLAEIWDRMLLERPPESFFIPRLDFARPSADNAEPRGGAPLIGGGRWGTSENWSGAVIAARNDMRFAVAAAIWTVPVPQLPPGASFKNLPANDDWRASFWVGLDGHRLASQSLPQIGTTIVIEGGKQPPVFRAYAWAQWWVRNRRFGEIEITNFDVAPGDTVIAWLTVISPVAVLFNIRNLSSPTMPGGILWAAGSPDVAKDPPGGDRSMAPVEGSAACWIAERPLSMPPPLAKVPDVLYPLPDFGSMTFDICAAGMTDPDDPVSPLIQRTLTAARYIRMVEVAADAPPRSRVISAPKAPASGGPSMTIDYVAP
jgi:hypothetical protein